MLRPRPSVSAIPALRRSSWAAVRDDVAAAAGGGPLSQQSTARSRSNSLQDEALSLPLSSQATLLRLQRILSSQEQERLSDLFHRAYRGYVTPTTLPALLQAAGVSLPSVPSGADVALEDVIRRALEYELEVHGFKAKPTGKPATSTGDGGGSTGGGGSATSGGAQPALHRAVSKIASARRLSARLSARATARQSFGAALTSGAPSTSRDTAASSSQPLTPVPPTLSFAQVLWVCRVLKDDLDAVQRSTPADANPETLEAFRSCADESTGLVTLRSVQARCQTFQVRLDGDGVALGSDAAESIHRSSQRLSEDGDDDRDSNRNGFPGDVLNPSQFASLILPPGDVSLSLPSPAAVLGGGSVPVRTSGLPQPRSSARGTGLGARPQTAPQGFATAAGGMSLASRSRSSGALLSPQQFVSVPYSEQELEWFRECEDVYRSPTRNPRDVHCDANPIVNSLLGQSVVTPSTTAAAAGAPVVTSAGRHHHHLGIAPLSHLASVVTVAHHQGGGSGDSATGRSPRDDYSALAATGGGAGGLAAPPSFMATTVAGSSSPHSYTVIAHPHLQSPASSPLSGGTSAAAAALNASYFLSAGSVVGERPFTAPQFGTTTTAAASSCARDEAHQARLRAASIARDFPPMRAVVEAGGEGQRFLTSVAERASHLHKSSLEVRSQATGAQRISVGADNTGFAHSWAPTTTITASGGVTSRGGGGEQLDSHGAPGSQIVIHPHHHSLGNMVESQRREESVNPLRAAVLGPYYSTLAVERQAGLLSAAAASPTVSSSVNLDSDFPLHGLSWNKLATSQPEIRHKDVLRSLGDANRNSSGGGVENVVGRLTMLHKEKPSVSLHRLHKQLEMLESSAHQWERDHGGAKRAKVRGGGSATQRLMRFRRLAGKDDNDDDDEMSLK